ncbi:MAG TPA: NAD(P)H-hydrate epimerase, partial [Ilumatobacteraceae bacterium]|nr:NAD(P)H-hydrate epimerase [Ilumatobacteraceae bacterium]
GAQVRVVDAADAPARIERADLVIDAAYGTGFRGEWVAPSVGDGVAVLAVDIPSGVDGLTGRAGVGVLAADATVVLAALKPGVLFGAGAALAG